MRYRHKLNVFISLLLLSLLLTCQKDENVPLDQFKIIQENVTATATAVSFKVYYVYGQNKPCKLDYVNVYYGKDNEVKNPLHAKCELKEDNDGTYFQVNLNDLEALTTYYYYYEVANAINAMNTEENEFTTNDYGIPSVTTVSVTNITGSGAKFNGTVSDGGELTVTERGFCYGTNSGNLTVSGQHIVVGSGLGSFSSNVTGLSPSTTYYMRAYAKNSKGVAYGSVKSYTTTNGLPTVTTNNVSSITSTSASCGGNVTSDGGYTVTVRGVCWSTSQYPTVSNSHTTNSGGTGNFMSTMTGLSAGTTYYVRAYATNSKGTSYGAQKTFTTTGNPPCPGANTVTDYDGNVYQTVQIGNQCWMRENLRTTHYANGTYIELGYAYGSNSTAYRYNPYNNSSNVNTYGYLYNWAAVMHGSMSSVLNPSGVQGICPTGWHVPSLSEWTQLKNFVSGQSQYLCDDTYGNIAKALASTTGWMSSSVNCAVGNNLSLNNYTGFSAMPAGSFYNGTYYFSNEAEFWSTQEGDDYGSGSVSARVFNIYYNNAGVSTSSAVYKEAGISVRCVRN